MSEGVTLARLVGGQVPVQWYEAVAVVREVADRLGQSGDARLIPGLQQAPGSVTLDSVAPLPSKEPKKEETAVAPRDTGSRRLLFGAIAALIVIVSVGAVVYLRSRGLAPRNASDVSALANRVSNAVGAA